MLEVGDVGRVGGGGGGGTLVQDPGSSCFCRRQTRSESEVPLRSSDFWSWSYGLRAGIGMTIIPTPV